MRLLDRLTGIQGQDDARPAADEASAGRNLFGLVGALPLPPGVEEDAAVLVSRNRPQENQRLLAAYARAHDWKAAFPYAVAHAKQSWTPAAIKHVGVCFLKSAEAAAALAARTRGRVSAQDRDRLHSAVTFLTLAIDHGEHDAGVYHLRGAAHLLEAQLDRDRRALDLAEADFRKSLSIQPSDVVRRCLARIEDLRVRLFSQ